MFHAFNTCFLMEGKGFQNMTFCEAYLALSAHGAPKIGEYTK
ncbi:hypothetical protein RIEGSTA812A_PEG_508 [invertebrate metagenome]|uniref:Uncharacterized protein n=1 Tax=invertebrate metagenome TaxID=1711999 RepID=A0A484H6Q0_9ZZZZ